MATYKKNWAPWSCRCFGGGLAETGFGAKAQRPWHSKFSTSANPWWLPNPATKFSNHWMPWHLFSPPPYFLSPALPFPPCPLISPPPPPFLFPPPRMSPTSIFSRPSSCPSFRPSSYSCCLTLLVSLWSLFYQEWSWAPSSIPNMFLTPTSSALGRIGIWPTSWATTWRQRVAKRTNYSLTLTPVHSMQSPTTPPRPQTDDRKQWCFDRNGNRP